MTWYRRRLLVPIVLMAVLAVTAGCTSDSARAAADGSGVPTVGRLPSPHVHGVAVNLGDGRVYLASHDGLFRYKDTGPERVGPVIDLMGFTVAGPNHFYASGHPGQGSDLPDPVGLIESVDAGATWSTVSRQGQSDFHALAASTAGVLGYDGTLRATPDGAVWEDLATPGSVAALASSPDGGTVLATNTVGLLLRSTDAGRTWAQITDAPPLSAVAWAGGNVAVGVAPDGSVAVSADAGESWHLRGSAALPPLAIGATGAVGEAPLRILVVTHEDVLDSTDGGVTFAALRSGLPPR